MKSSNTQSKDKNDSEFPCKKCISYAICKHKEEIDCIALYGYIEDRNSFPIEMPDVIKVGLGELSHYDYMVLKKSTTRWFPDS